MGLFVHSFFNLAVGVNQTAILTELSVSLNLITYRQQLAESEEPQKIREKIQASLVRQKIYRILFITLLVVNTVCCLVFCMLLEFEI